MATGSNLGALGRAAYRDTHRDGLTDLVMGLVLFIVALAFGRPAFYWTYLVAIVALGPGLQRLKARWTYPRVGYVEVPDEDPGKLGRGIVGYALAVFLAFALAFVLFGDVSDNLLWRRWSPAMAALLVAGGFLYASSRSGLWRFRIYALLGVALGVWISLASAAVRYQGVRVWALVMSLVLLVSGALILRSFLRDHPVVASRDADAD